MGLVDLVKWEWDVAVGDHGQNTIKATEHIALGSALDTVGHAC
jgi:hypothetical protein